MCLSQGSSYESHTGGLDSRTELPVSAMICRSLDGVGGMSAPAAARLHRLPAGYYDSSPAR